MYDLSMKNALLIGVLVLILAVAGGVSYFSSNDAVTEEQGTTLADGERVMEPEETTPGKLKADVFSGTLEEVNEGCYYDAECYVVVDGKHVTVLRGWSQETVGSVQGVENFGDLTKRIGQNVEVYAHDKGDGTYTLYGSAGFYVKLVK